MPVAVACRVLKVSTSGFYDWRSRRPSRRQVAEDALIGTIQQVHADSRATYGSPRVHAELRLRLGVHVGRKRVARLMRQASLIGVSHRRKRRGWKPDSTIVHTDRGAQNTSWLFGHRPRQAGLLGSMGRVASSLDNALIESFWSTMQRELLDRTTWETRTQLASATFEWIEGFYNPRRRHTSLGHLAPAEFDALHTTTPAGA